MFHKAKINLTVVIAVCGLLGIIFSARVDVLAQKQATTMKAHKVAATQPLYSEYKGVRIGTTTEEARRKLGEPTQKADAQDLYLFSEKETAQIYYDALHKVVAISIDYLGVGSGAPDYKEVVGEAELKPNGSLYKLVRYEPDGFWVSYNRTAGDLSIVSITIQKIN